MGQVITFYSYKGGVGRTMALANIATLMSQWGYKTLLVDWDLEAPGLEYYFKNYLDVQDIAQREGLVDLFERAKDKEGELLSESMDWQNFVIEVTVPDAKEKIHLITAGKRHKNSQYFDKVTSLNWDSFYEHRGGFLIESLRNGWKEAYDFVLIDSRTGITDIGGICTIQLPDVLVLLFTATDQSLKGITEVAAKSQKAQWNLPFDRFSLTCLPIPSRFDSNEEFTISREWLSRFSKELKGIYDDWLPTFIDRKQFLEVTKIPYSSYFSFGEKLPVIEQGTTDPTGLGYAYENIAAIITNDFESVDEIIDNRDVLVQKQSKKKSVKVFIAHQLVDIEKVRALYRRLERAGYIPWTEEEDLIPGQNRITSITEALSKSDIFLMCVSEETIKAAMQSPSGGYLLSPQNNRWISHNTKPYVIPLKFGNFDVREKYEFSDTILQDIEWLNYDSPDSFARLTEAIEYWSNQG